MVMLVYDLNKPAVLKLCYVYHWCLVVIRRLNVGTRNVMWWGGMQNNKLIFLLKFCNGSNIILCFLEIGTKIYTIKNVPK